MAEELTDAQRTIVEHLRAGVARGTSFFKSKRIAEATDLTPKQVGVNLGFIAEDCDEIEVEKWGRSTSATWHVRDAADSA
jgi:hypothetical protein